MDSGMDINGKINLLHLVHGLKMGGAENALYHYIKALGIERYNHHVYLISHFHSRQQHLLVFSLCIVQGYCWPQILLQ